MAAKGVAAVLVVLVAVAGGAAIVATRSEDSPPPSSGRSPQPVEDTSPSSAAPIPEDAYLRRACKMPDEWIRYIRRGWDPGAARDQDLVVVPKSDNYIGSLINASHSGPYDFLQEVPLVAYGPGFIEPKGRITLDREVTVADIAPTLAKLMGMEFDVATSRPIDEILRSTEERPKMIFVGVIDGGGWNALEQWPDAWPELKSIMEKGATIDNAVVGSSPSITPAVHSNISTGTWPRYHGVTAIVVRGPDGELGGAFAEKATDNVTAHIVPDASLRRPTINDLWDESNANEPLIGGVIPGNYPLGMLSLGSVYPGGDKDILMAQGFADEGWITQSDYYSLPDYLNDQAGDRTPYTDALDRADGAADQRWRGHQISPFYATPAYAPWQTEGAKVVMEGEGFGEDDLTDLFWINYKSPDAAGHLWNVLGPEQEDVLGSVDAAIGDTVDWLEENVGRDNFVFILTADHGQTPIDGDGWAIDRSELVQDINARCGQGVLEQTSASSFFMDREGMRENGTESEEISSFLVDYRIQDNVPDGEEIPAGYEGRERETIFEAVFPGRRIDEVAACTEGD